MISLGIRLRNGHEHVLLLADRCPARHQQVLERRVVDRESNVERRTLGRGRADVKHHLARIHRGIDPIRSGSTRKTPKQTKMAHAFSTDCIVLPIAATSSELLTSERDGIHSCLLTVYGFLLDGNHHLIIPLES